MNYTIETFLDEPIMIWTPSLEFSFSAEALKEADEEAIAIWEASPEPVYFIADLSQTRMTFSALVTATADVLYGEKSLWNHPKLKLIVAITQDPSVQMVANNVLQNKDGYSVYTLNHPIFLMDSREKALAYIREQRHSQ